jgi:hypothetical protein
MLKKIGRIAGIILLAVCPAAVPASATDLPVLGGTLNVNLLVNATSVTLKDPLDSIYVGTLKEGTNLGFGGEASLFYPVVPGINAGPHFIFNYSPLGSNLYDMQLFQTSLGGIVEFALGENNSVSFFADYDLGWFAAQPQGASAVGDFAGGIPGFHLGLKTYSRVTDAIGVGLYYQMAQLALAGVKYRSGSGFAWMDAGISLSQFGGTVYF